MIHCIGDSHSCIFSANGIQPIWPQLSNDKTPYFKSYRIGPATSTHIKNKKEIIDDIVQKKYNNGDIILFCFGEIDCRIFFKNKIDYYSQNRTVLNKLGEWGEMEAKTDEDIISHIVNRYFNWVKENYANYNIAFWGPIASFREDLIDYVKHNIMFTGTNKERNHITKIFNEKLQKICSENNIPFVTVFYEMINENLVTNIEMTDMNIHLNDNMMPLIIDKFKKEKLINE
jgi:lysophospholipase L1-like esterase